MVRIAWNLLGGQHLYEINGGCQDTAALGVWTRPLEETL